jgi:hypothetical protein
MTFIFGLFVPHTFGVQDVEGVLLLGVMIRSVPMHSSLKSIFDSFAPKDAASFWSRLFRARVAGSRTQIFPDT